MMACDICGAKGLEHIALLECYQTAEIKTICPGCEKIVNDEARELGTWAQRVHETLCKRFMTNRRTNFLGPNTSRPHSAI